jgi:(p)ppGpp synthase/HD superfamily hydrolase
LHAAVHREHRHPQRVALADPEDQIAAVLHDAIEDTDLELADLTEAGYSAEIVAAVDSLTHRAMESYEDYIDRVAANEIARPVKVADLRENLANNL